jgi:hypothetical protein
MGKSRFETYATSVGLTLALVLCAVTAKAQDYSSRIRERKTEQAYRQLLHANIFNLGGIGFVLTITPEEKAFHTLLRSGNSVELFKRLLSEANPEGQLYALYGLYLEKPQLFKNEVERFKREIGPAERWERMTFIEKGKVRTGVGCVLFRQERQTLIAKIANGDFDQAFEASSSRLKN